MPAPVVYMVELRSDRRDPHPGRTLARFLKAALRSYGLKCLSVAERPDEARPAPVPVGTPEQGQERHRGFPLPGGSQPVRPEATS